MFAPTGPSVLNTCPAVPAGLVVGPSVSPEIVVAPGAPSAPVPPAAGAQSPSARKKWPGFVVESTSGTNPGRPPVNSGAREPPLCCTPRCPTWPSPSWSGIVSCNRPSRISAPTAAEWRGRAVQRPLRRAFSPHSCARCASAPTRAQSTPSRSRLRPRSTSSLPIPVRSSRLRLADLCLADLLHALLGLFTPLHHPTLLRWRGFLGAFGGCRLAHRDRRLCQPHRNLRHQKPSRLNPPPSC